VVRCPVVSSPQSCRALRHALCALPVQICENPCCSLCLFLRVLRVLRGKTVCHHEEHEGHEVWITRHAKNARLQKSFAALCVFARVIPIIVRNRQVFVCRRLRTNKKGDVCVSQRKSAVNYLISSLRPLRLCGESPSLHLQRLSGTLCAMRSALGAWRFVCVGLRLSNASPPNGAMFLFVVVSRQTKK